MLSVIIADDEAGVIELCKMLIDYPDVQIVGEAQNGIQLLEQIEALQPNTVITDISMPGLSGLELIELVQSRFPDVHFIVISGHTEFEYVQRALRFGVWDYLLKPIQRSEINRVLSKLDAYLKEREMTSHEKAQIEQQLQDSIDVLKRQCMEKIWKYGYGAEDEIVISDIFNFNERHMLCIQVVADIRVQNGQIYGRELFQSTKTVYEGLESIFETRCCDVVAFPDGHSKVYFLLLDSHAPDSDHADLTASINRSLQQFNDRSRFVVMAGGMSQMMPASQGQLIGLMDQCKFAVRTRIENSTASVLLYEAKHQNRVDAWVKSVDFERLRMVIAELDEDKICQAIKQIWQQLPVIPGGHATLLSVMLKHIMQAFDMLPNVDDVISELQITPEAILQKAFSRAQIRDDLCEAVSQALRQYLNFIDNRGNSMINKAKQYIKKYYNTDITLESVAGHVSLSPSYFSALFKNETQMGFVKYLQTVRIEHAKWMLRETDETIETIARSVGYKDVRHFTKIFRSETRVKPSEYRKFY